MKKSLTTAIEPLDLLNLSFNYDGDIKIKDGDYKKKIEANGDVKIKDGDTKIKIKDGKKKVKKD